MPELVRPPAGLAYSRDPAHLHPDLRARVPLLLESYKARTGLDLFITCTWRSVQEQGRLFAMGRTAPGLPCWHAGEKLARKVGACKDHPLGLVVTWVDGITKVGRHNVFPAEALDVCVDTDPDVLKVRVSWDYRLYEPLVDICSRIGLVSGGSWKKKDWPHIELPA